MWKCIEIRTQSRILVPRVWLFAMLLLVPHVLSAQLVRVMTYNILEPGWTDSRAELIAEFIRAEGPDIVSLQEAFVQQQTDLSARLSDTYDFYGFGDDNGQPILVGKSEFTLVTSGSVLVPLDCGGPRYVNYLLLEHAGSDESFFIYNSHFCPLIVSFPPGLPTAAERNEAHAATLATTINDNSLTWPVPVVVTGDLNASRATPTMRFLLDNETLPSGENNTVELENSWEVLRSDEPKPSPAIDWILFTPQNLGVIAADVVRNMQTMAASDHNPVLATLELGGSTPIPGDEAFPETAVSSGGGGGAADWWFLLAAVICLFLKRYARPVMAASCTFWGQL